MDWREEQRRKAMSADAAVAVVKDGDRVRITLLRTTDRRAGAASCRASGRALVRPLTRAQAALARLTRRTAGVYWRRIEETRDAL